MKHARRSLLTALSLLLIIVACAQAQKLPSAPFIFANNNPVVIPTGQTSGTVTLVWDGGKDHPYAEVWIRVDQNDETFIVEQGKGTRNVEVEFGRSYEFKLSDANVLLASVRVTVTHEMSDTQESAPKVTASNFAGCWTFAGKGYFAGAGLGCFKQDGDRVSFDDPTFEGIVVGNILRFKLKSGLKNTPYAFRSGKFRMQRGGKQFIGSVNASLNPDDNEYAVIATLDQFGGCWAFSGRGAFAGEGLGCFKQEGDLVSFENPIFEGIVVGNVLRFKLKSGITNTAYAFHSGRFVMNKDGKSFVGSVNIGLNPDANDYAVTGTRDKSPKKTK